MPIHTQTHTHKHKLTHTNTHTHIRTHAQNTQTFKSLHNHGNRETRPLGSENLKNTTQVYWELYNSDTKLNYGIC